MSAHTIARYLLVLAALGYSCPAAAQYVISTLAGNSDVGDGRPAVLAQIGSAEGVAADGRGNLYVADALDHRLRQVAPDGLIRTVAGTGHPGFGGDGGPAGGALVSHPYGVAIDNGGSVYIADLGNGRVRRVTPDGVIRSVAAGFREPRNVVVDGAGNLYVSDFADHRVFQVTRTGAVIPVAGTGAPGFDGDGKATAVRLNAPAGLAVDARGTVYIADSGNHRIRRLLGGSLQTVLGGEGLGLNQPTGLAVDSAGNLYVADSGNHRIMRRTPAGAVAILAGLGREPIRDIAADAGGNLYVAGGSRVRRISGNGAISMVAGDGTFGDPRDGGPASLARLNGPIGVALDGAGNLYIADEGNRRIRRVTPDGRIATVSAQGSGPLVDPVAVAADGGGVWIADHLGGRVLRWLPGGSLQTVAGSGREGFSGDGGAALDGVLNRPRGIAADLSGNVYVADSFNHRVRKIGSDGRITTVAGSGRQGYGGDGGPAREGLLNTPSGLSFDSSGNLYIAEAGNHTVRKVTPDGVIQTVAGRGTPGYSGDGAAASSAFLRAPVGVGVDFAGILYIADSGNHRVRAVDRHGVIRTIAGDGVPGFAGDGGPALSSRLRFPSSLAVDPTGRLYVADSGNHRIRLLTPSAALLPLAPPALETATVLHAARLRPGPVAPGQIVVIAGQSEPAEIRFNGVGARILESRNGLLHVLVPRELVAPAAAELEIYRKGELRARASVEMAAAAPGVFAGERGFGQALALNQDGSLNSPEHPAPLGSVVTLFVTGEGAGPAAPEFLQVRVGGLPSEIVFAGEAPGYAGVLQMNVRLPGAFLASGAATVIVIAGAAPSQADVTIAVR